MTALFLKVVGGLVGFGLPEGVAKFLTLAAAAVSLALTAWGAWQGWLYLHDQGVIKEAFKDANAEAESNARAADQENAQSQRADDRRTTDESRELDGVLENDPEADRPLTDSERAHLRCVRLQQQARANGEPAPAC